MAENSAVQWECTQSPTIRSAVRIQPALLYLTVVQILLGTNFSPSPTQM